MLSAPGYWLAPCLVALAAWINDRQELADRAVREAIKRDDEKTSLLFALICRRADRKSASLKWTQRYLANQDEERLDRKCVIILDAFASGLLGSDSEGVVAKQLEDWMTRLSDKPGFVEQQTTQWSDAINLKREPYTEGYTYLRKYSKTWPKLQYIMEGAYLHATIFGYFSNIFDQQSSGAALKEQLDDILQSLVTDFDDEELPLRRDERLNQFIIDYDGDLPRAQQSMQVEQTAFDTHKDFTQLLTDSAMKPESSNVSVSTQKFAIALSRDWIANAYNDVVAKNRMQIPNEVEVNIDNFNDITHDGKNENELVEKFEAMVEQEKRDALAQNKMTAFQQFSLWGGVAIGGIGVIMLFANPLLGLIAVIAGIGMVINHFSKKKAVEVRRQSIEQQYEEKRESGVQIVRATLAEVVDFRAEFAEKDAESAKVVDFLDQIKPEQYIRKLSDSTRRIRTGI
jgi:Na+-transporting methylmalonyl-CoA/oxaloacetate decarboxylase gamma subunit